MKKSDLEKLINSVFAEIEKQIPKFQNSKTDWSISEGNVAVCVITPDGEVYGKIFGHDKLRGRQFYSVAWKKASQVWVTGFKTGEYEKKVWNGELHPEEASVIDLPDLIGWEGGQPIQISDEITLSVGFSGFKGYNDLAIAKEAFERVLNN